MNKKENIEKNNPKEIAEIEGAVSEEDIEEVTGGKSGLLFSKVTPGSIKTEKNMRDPFFPHIVS